MILPLVLRLYIISFVYTWISPYDTINCITHNKLLHCRLWQLNMLHNVWLPSYVIMSQCKLCQIPKPAFTYVKHWKFRTFIWKTLHVSLSQEESYNTCDQNNVYSHKKLHNSMPMPKIRKNGVNSANYLQLLTERFIQWGVIEKFDIDKF